MHSGETGCDSVFITEAQMYNLRWAVFLHNHQSTWSTELSPHAPHSYRTLNIYCNININKN